MRRAVLFGLAVALLGCSASGSARSDGSSDVPSAQPFDALGDVFGDPIACGCNIVDEGTLALSWSCYCGQSFADCQAPESPSAACGSTKRIDYPSCGLSVIFNFTTAGYEVPSVYDAQGNLVGRIAHSDLSGYLCPTDPSMASATELAGQFPASTCRGVTCGSCYAGPFPCGWPDAGSDADADTDARPARDGASDRALD